MSYSEISWTAQALYPILGVLQLLPLAAAAVMLMLRSSRWAMAVGLAAAAAELLVALDLYRLYDQASAAMQFAEHFRLAGPFAYHAAADGLTVLFVLLNAVLSLLVVFYSQARGLAPLPRVLLMVFVVEAALMSLLVTVDLLWFLLMSALQLLPVGYLLWRWATSPEKDMMLTRFLQFMSIGLLLLLGGTLMLGWNYADATGGGWSFDLYQLSSVGVSTPIRSLVFFLLFYGLAIRTPLFPLHGWLPLVAEHGSIAVAPVFLLGLKTGIYGLLRYVLPLMPETVLQWQPFIVAFAVTGVFYAALLAILQDNLRRLLAFAVVSHTSVLVIGLFSLGELSFEGSVLLTVNFGLAIAGLTFMSGLVYRRTGTMQLKRLGGLFDRLPVIGIAFLVAALSIVGMPGTPGFDAVHLVLEDAMHRFGALVTIAAALGNVVAAGFLLLAFQRAFLARRAAGLAQWDVAPPTLLEQAVAVMVILILLGTGFYSEPWLELVEQPLQGLSTLFATGESH
jgi:NADH-quinone oxidoreductase subunit M